MKEFGAPEASKDRDEDLRICYCGCGRKVTLSRTSLNRLSSELFRVAEVGALLSGALIEKSIPNTSEEQAYRFSEEIRGSVALVSTHSKLIHDISLGLAAQPATSILSIVRKDEYLLIDSIAEALSACLMSVAITQDQFLSVREVLSTRQNMRLDWAYRTRK